MFIEISLPIKHLNRGEKLRAAMKFFVSGVGRGRREDGELLTSGRNMDDWLIATVK
jgi:hypothetical protein